MLKPTKSTLQKIESIFHDLDYIVRYERGNFNSGYCIVEDKKIAVINRFFDTEGRINCLLDILSNIVVMDDLLSERNRLLYRQILKLELSYPEENEVFNLE